MKYGVLNAVAVAAVLTLHLSYGTGDVPAVKPPNDLPGQVRAILAAKCSECHGAGLKRPEAGLYLDDLATLAAGPYFVVPFDADGSYLWRLVRDDDMPAKGAKAGPLSQHEKELVRAWIAAGAPVPGAPVAPKPVPPHVTSEAVAPAPVSPPAASRPVGGHGWWPIAVIFPAIALLATATLGLLIAALRYCARTKSAAGTKAKSA